MDDELNHDTLRRAVSAIRAPVPIANGLEARVAARGQRDGRRSHALRAGGLVVATAAAAILVLRPSTDGQQVTFALRAPAVESVALVGDFTDWRTDRVKLEPRSDGEWQVTVKLPPGRYRFAYVVDNAEWRADAQAAPVLDDFGRPTSILTVADE